MEVSNPSEKPLPPEGHVNVALTGWAGLVTGVQHT